MRWVTWVLVLAIGLFQYNFWVSKGNYQEMLSFSFLRVISDSHYKNLNRLAHKQGKYDLFDIPILHTL